MKNLKQVFTVSLVFSIILSVFSIPMVLAEVMSFDEAINALRSDKLNIISVSYGVTGGLEQSAFVGEDGITGILVWLSPNGTFYQVEYPSEKILGKIAESYNSDLNPPDGYVFWWLNFGDGEEYWVDVSDGSIIHRTSPRGGGPSNDDPFSALSSVIVGFLTSTSGILLLIIALLFVGFIAFLVVVGNRKRKQNLRRED